MGDGTFPHSFTRLPFTLLNSITWITTTTTPTTTPTTTTTTTTGIDYYYIFSAMSRIA